MLYLLRRYRTSDYLEEKKPLAEDEQEKLDPATIPYRGTKLTLTGVALAAYSAVEVSHFFFLTTLLQYIGNKFEPDEASHVVSIMSAAYTVGRLATAFISLRLPANLILTYHYTIIVGSLVLLYLGQSSHRLIYAGTVTIGYGFSAMWPAMFDFTSAPEGRAISLK